MTPGGIAALEVGQGQAAQVALILEENGLTIIEISKDLSGIERCVIAEKR